MRKSSKSRYAQLQRQSLISLDTERNRRIGGVQQGTDDTGGPSLRLVFAPNEHHDVTFLFQLPNLAQPVARSLFEWGRGPGVTSRSTRALAVENLRLGWVSYLLEGRLAELRLEDLDTAHVNGFIAWLNRTANDGVAQLAPETRAKRLTVLRTIIGKLRSIYPDRVRRSLHVRDNPWPGRSRQITPTEIVPRATWQRLYEAARGEVIDIVARFEDGQRLISEGRSKLPLSPNSTQDYADLAVCLAALDKEFPGLIPRRDDLVVASPFLGRAVRHRHKLTTVALYFYPSARVLVPFVVLLGMYTLFNGDPLLTLSWNGVRHDEPFGQKRVVISADKGRSHQTQTRSFPVDEDPANPEFLLAFLDRWTKRIRPLAPPAIQDRVFLWVPLSREALTVRTFEHIGGRPSSSCAWKFSLASFLADHQLGKLGLRNIRATGLDLVDDLFVGDLRAVMAAGGQRSPDTIHKHYTSDAARRRNDERLAGVMSARERWLDSNGNIDPRGQSGTADIFAATPGAGCADPYASPQPGQKSGRLCAAYGACWACPLFVLRRSDPYQLARALQFKAEIERARGYLPPLRWLAAWAPQLTALNERILPQFGESGVIAEAERRLASLLPLSRLD